jgi:S1-C subfamily serine protease
MLKPLLRISYQLRDKLLSSRGLFTHVKKINHEITFYKLHTHQNNDTKKLSSALWCLALLTLGSTDDEKIKLLENRGAKFNFIADVVEVVMPSVVHIESFGNSPFGTMALSHGSGFIVSEDGYILTNAHVVRNQTKVIVKLHDGQQRTGKVIKVDELSDVAVIKIPGVCIVLKLSLFDSKFS